MKVLVTGAAGFIGEWVMKELAANEYITVAFSGDVRNENTFPRGFFDVIIHLAALIPHRQHQTDGDFCEVNVQGTKNLCKAFPTAKMVFISTTDIDRTQISEYGKSKLEAEKIIEKQENYVIIRLPSVFGPKQRQNKLIPLLFRKYCQNGECTINNNDTREYIYVEDVAKQIISKILEKGIITLRGYKIRNFDLDTMIRAVCKGEIISELTFEEQEFLVRLTQCLPTYQERTV